MLEVVVNDVELDPLDSLESESLCSLGSGSVFGCEGSAGAGVGVVLGFVVEVD